MINLLRIVYRRYVHVPALDRLLYAVLDALTNLYSRMRGWSFPAYYARRGKLDMLFGLYEKETYAIFEKCITPGMVTVDIGAHIGYFTRQFARLTGRTGMVLALEADPDNYALLERNSTRYPNVRTFQLAASDRAGTIDFYHCTTRAGCHTTLPRIPLDFPMKKMTVPADTLDAVLAREDINRVDLIKMDIEGGEYAALQGMQKTLRRHGPLTLLVEFAPAWVEAAGIAPEDFLKFLSSFGFTMSAVTMEGLQELRPESFGDYTRFIPRSKDGSAFGEFVNLLCEK